MQIHSACRACCSAGLASQVCSVDSENLLVSYPDGCLRSQGSPGGAASEAD